MDTKTSSNIVLFFKILRLPLKYSKTNDSINSIPLIESNIYNLI